MVNLNMRTLTDGTVFIHYSEEGKAKDGSFRNFGEFVAWLHSKINE